MKKVDDNDIRKAFRSLNIPSADEEKKEQTVKKAVRVFKETEKNLQGEKKPQGFSVPARLMGKIRNLVPKGEPIMTTARLATMAAAVIALGIALSVPLATRNLPKNPLTVPGRIQSTPEKHDRAEPAVAANISPGDNEQTPSAPGTITGKADQAPAASPAAPDVATSAGQGSNTPKIEGHAVRQELEASPETARTPVSENRMGGRRKFAEEKSIAAADRSADALRSAPSVAPSSPMEHFAPAAGVAKRALVDSARMPMPQGEPRTEFYQDTGRDVFDTTQPNPVQLVAEHPVSTFSVDVDTASYSFVRRQLNNGVMPQKNAVRVEELVNYFDYDYALPKDRKQPFLPSVAVYPCPWNENTRILHIGIKGYDIEPAEKPRSNLVFLIDVSGSMNHPEKLPLLKNAMKLLVNKLEPEDTVSLVVYAGAAGVVLEPTPVREKGRILAALENLQAGGSTAGGQGIELAYSMAEMHFDKKAVNRVVLATDGDFNVGITNRDELKSFIERKRETGIFLSVLGFGQGNYNDALMQALAQNGNGNAAYIDNLNEARKVLVDEAAATLFTIAKDVKIQVEFNPARVHSYRLIGYETRMLRREDFNNDKVDAAEIGSGHTVTALYEFTPAGSEAKPVDDLRYQPAKEIPPKADSSEIAFLKIRYKLPDSDTSTLLTRPITGADEYKAFADAPQEMRFAAAVAGFGQLLRQDAFVKDLDYKKVLSIGQAAKGDDPYGYRAEFLNLVRLTESAKGM